ncbi:MAG: anthranilate synthase component I family protein [Planctomycetota bacterium]
MVHELANPPAPDEAFARLSALPHAVFFDSARPHETLGRYSYVAAGPTEWRVATTAEDPVRVLRGLNSRACGIRADGRRGEWGVTPVAGLPPWQGGVAGMIGYEIGQAIESLPTARWDEFRLPVLAAGVYEWVLAYDHSKQRAWIIAQNGPSGGGADRQIAKVLRILDAPPAQTSPEVGGSSLPRAELAPQHELRGVLSDFTRDDYLRAVGKVQERLQAGDAFQANLSQRLLYPDPGDAVAGFLRMREHNPAPFASFLDGGAWQIASASPERFLSVRGRTIETRPIKGTRPRGATPADDDRLAAELAASAKERAENVMIVDLMRNDLSRVGEDDSVCVPELFGVERYAHVQHLVSVVRARLRADRDVVDLLAATLPAGSITGAPKVRVQQIIAELEPTARGPYCGTMFWLGLPNENGAQAMDSSVLIRTRVHARGWVQASVGGGITVGSCPEREYEETWQKAVGLIEPQDR